MVGSRVRLSVFQTLRVLYPSGKTGRRGFSSRLQNAVDADEFRLEIFRLGDQSPANPLLFVQRKRCIDLILTFGSYRIPPR